MHGETLRNCFMEFLCILMQWYASYVDVIKVYIILYLKINYVLNIT